MPTQPEGKNCFIMNHGSEDLGGTAYDVSAKIGL